MDEQIEETGRTPGGAAGAEGDDHAAGREEAPRLAPMLRPVRRFPGRREVTFAPLQAYALTRVSQADFDHLDEDLWWVERPLKAVHKGRIMVGGEWWRGHGLDDLNTGPRGSTRPNLVVRYDRALLARGVLDEVIVLEKTSEGYIERSRCVHETEYLARVDSETVIREREAKIREYQATLSRKEQERLTLTHGTEAVRRLQEERLAGERLQRMAKRAPVVAEPERVGGAEAKPSRLSRILAYEQADRVDGAPAEAETTPAKAPTQVSVIPAPRSHASKDARQSKKASDSEAAADTPAPLEEQTEEVASRSSRRSSLAKLLGARVGFG